MEPHIVWALTTLLSAFVGSFLAGYLKKKGENLATHEDINKLVNQVDAVTTRTKEIEAKISNEMWDRQKRWEIKRDAYFDAMKELATAEDALLYLDATFRAAKKASGGMPVPSFLMDRKVEAAETWSRALLGFKRASTLAALVSENDVKRAFGKVNRSMLQMVSDVYNDKMEQFWNALPILVSEMEHLTEAVRKELRVDEKS